MVISRIDLVLLRSFGILSCNVINDVTEKKNLEIFFFFCKCRGLHSKDIMDIQKNVIRQKSMVPQDRAFSILRQLDSEQLNYIVYGKLRAILRPFRYYVFKYCYLNIVKIEFQIREKKTKYKYLLNASQVTW